MTQYRFLTLSLLTLTLSGFALIACGDLDSEGQCDPDTDTGCICSNDDGVVVDNCDADEADDSCSCAIVDTGNTTGDTINISGAAFDPNTLTVTAGTTVTWTNNDAVQRAIVCKDAAGTDAFDQVLNANTSITFTFTNAGVYTCTDRLNPGPNLTGVITVN